MLYHYFCESECTVGDYAKSKADGLTMVVKKDSKNFKKELLVWEVSHLMRETPEIKCPVCNSKASKHYGFANVTFFFRGNWALDRAGCKREMDLSKLDSGQNQYEEWYQPGEKDDIRSKIIKAGKRAMRDKNLNNMPRQIRTSEKRLPRKKATTIKTA